MHIRVRPSVVAFFLLPSVIVSHPAAAQLDIDGTTGGWLNPWALVRPSPKHKFGKPALSYHFLDAGPVVGDVHTINLTIGANARTEFGYTRYVIEGPTPAISSDLSAGHFKWMIIKEKAGGCSYVPAVSVGTVFRSSSGRALSTADYYAVATRIVPAGRVSLLVNGGWKSTESSIYGIGGKVHREGALFGTGAVVFKKLLAFGVEAQQQPATQAAISRFVRLELSDRVHMVLAHATVEKALNADSQFAMSVTYQW